MKTLNSRMINQRSQGGFTIIELVVVILLLGILTATALPRFLDVTDQAHDAVVQGVLGGLNTGVTLFRSQWIANGQPGGTDAVTGYGSVAAELLTANTSGYPVGASGADDATLDQTDCQNVFIGLLQVGRPSSAADTTNNPAAAGDVTTTGDFSIHQGSAVTACAFVYVAQGAGESYPVIRYDSVTGAVTLDATEI